MIDHLGSQPRCLTGFVFSGGVCGLIGCKPTNLTTFTAFTRMLVVHGCIQPLTSVEGAIRLFQFPGESKSACPIQSAAHALHSREEMDREWVPVTRSLEPGIASKICLSLVEWPSQVCTHRPSHCISSRSSEVVTRCPSWKVGMDRARFLLGALLNSISATIGAPLLGSKPLKINPPAQVV